MLGYINNPLALLGIVVSFLVAITVHEFSHALVSDRLGDPTARLMGRVSLHPLVHLDPIGTLLLLFAPFGYAKPVQVDPFNLRNPRRDMALVSLAGPASNLVTAAVFSVIYQLAAGLAGSAGMPVIIAMFFLRFLIILNVNLAVFNLIPIHPLDGFAIVRGILSEEYARQWQELQPYGMLFLFFMIFPVFGGTAPISRIMGPLTSFLLNIFLPGSPVI